MGYRCIFLGPAQSVSSIISAINHHQPSIIGLSYRLTPYTVKPLLERFFEEFEKLKLPNMRLYFAGTSKVVQIAKKFGRFDNFFVGGESYHEIISALKRTDSNEINDGTLDMSLDLISRLEWKKPFPLIRAHFGLPSLDETIKGIKKLAEKRVLDIISIAPDQNTQENFFHPEEQTKELSGAGGVPLRSKEDFKKLHKARLWGNTPLLRIYAGTRDFIKLAELYDETIQNAWAAIPIFWFNKMDGRGPLPLKKSIELHLKTIEWHAKNSIPVEINDPHHWSLRNAPDAIAVADMYLCGIIAKKLGIKHFIAQCMFNTPPNLSFEMDLAKMMAKVELLKTLEDESFQIIKQVRTGLASFPLNLNKAKGQLASATLIQLLLKPDIVHVVSFSEASHAAYPEDIIESCEIVDQVINRMSLCDFTLSKDKIDNRKKSLMDQARWIVNLIPQIGKILKIEGDPWINPEVLTFLVESGIFDAPHLKNNAFAKGEINTKIIEGYCDSINEKKRKISEKQRISRLLRKDDKLSKIINNELRKKEVFIKL
ncbi:MAG: methionine synthase [Candidatus Lokiarchaeota archaeon]|nr:methionine synthase [Candidatus Lokiarchaeota archaeon]MBD3202459.1 methionine synthase [Candidatus Lokiarchaeota archaeon]